MLATEITLASYFVKLICSYYSERILSIAVGKQPAITVTLYLGLPTGDKVMTAGEMHR